MRICLISPGHLSTNPRLVKEAQALQSAGHKVHVIHGRFKPWGSLNDVPLAKQIGSVTSVPFGPTEAAYPIYLRQSATRRAALISARLGLNLQSVTEAAHSPIVPDLIRAAQQIEADLYVAHYIAALPAAARAAKRYGARYAFDAEDFHLGDLPDAPQHALEKHIIHAIESRYLPDAAHITAASPLIAKAYAETYGISLPTVILNVFPKANAPISSTPCGSAVPGPSIYWFSQTIGAGRGLETAIKAIAAAKSAPHLYLRGGPVTGYDEQLRNLAKQAGAADRLHFLEPVPPAELERLGATYDLGYSGETGFSPNNLRSLGNKLFSFLLGGLPVLATATPAHQQVAEQLGEAMTLFPIDDEVALAAAMDSFLLHPQLLANARAHAWRLGQTQFNWDIVQARLTEIVEEAVTC